jgi:hypothetical protein
MIDCRILFEKMLAFSRLCFAVRDGPAVARRLPFPRQHTARQELAPVGRLFRGVGGDYFLLL